MAQIGRSRSLRVFLSSTYEDLKTYVHAAEEVMRESVDVDQFKHWEATGRPSVAECRDRVRACDALVVLVGNTYGWIPSRQEGGDGRTSITRFEVQWAREKPIPVLPFFIRDPSHPINESDPEMARLQGEFVAELQSTLAKPVSSVDGFREGLRQSIVALIGQYPGAGSGGPAQVGERIQGLYSQFLDRDEPRRRLCSTLMQSQYRGAAIVGRGGLGKSALANWVIDQLRSDGVVKQIIYLNSASLAPIKEFALFMATMEASGRPKLAYEGSWAALSSNPPRLIEVLLDVYGQSDILLVFDAFEHNLDKTGVIEPPIMRDFVKAFAQHQHGSKLLITTRQFPTLSAIEAAVLEEIELDRGLPPADAVSLLMNQSPAGIDREQVERAISAVDGIPFAVERMAFLLRSNRVLEVGNSIVREKTLDAFVALTHSTLSSHAHLTLQARAVFDEPVSIDSLKYVLAEALTPSMVESAVEELGRGHFLFKVGPDGLLGIHELDQQSSYRSIEKEGIVDRRQLHARAADDYARQCTDHDYWFEWTSYDELRSHLKRFHHLVEAGQPLAAAHAFSISKVEFLNYAGHVAEIRSMFADLDVGSELTRGLLVKRYALADCLAIVGPFDRAVTELQEVIDLARALGDPRAELSATYELGTVYRYTGRSMDAVQLFRSVTDRLPGDQPDELRAYYVYGHSLACSYAGLYGEAIRLGREQVRYGRRSGKSEFVGRGNSSLCLPYYRIGMASEAAVCAEQAARIFQNTARDYLVGFIENVHGLALYALGRSTEAVDTFARARDAGVRTGQRRATGLVGVNWGWTLYERGDLDGALSHIHDAIQVFEKMSEPDAHLSQNLREAFEYAGDADRRYEAEALWRFVENDYENPDLIRKSTVAERILSLGRHVPLKIRQAAESFLEETRNRLAGIGAELES